MEASFYHWTKWDVRIVKQPGKIYLDNVSAW